MLLGMLEIVMLGGLIIIVFGPAIARKFKKYKAIAIKRSKRLQRIVAKRKAEQLAQQEIRNAKIRIATISALCASLVFGSLYLAFWPLPMQVNAYAPDTQYAVDADLYSYVAADGVSAEYETLSIEGYQNITQVHFYDDWIYAAAEGGIILRIRENGTGLTEIVNTGGEITGFDFDAEGGIVFADAQYDAEGGALLKVSFDGFAVTVESLLSSLNDMTLASPTAVAVAPDGMVYFLNASEISTIDQGSMLQTLRTAQVAHSQDGTLYAYDPTTETCEAVVSGLCFGTGLALSPDGSTVYISTLTDASIWAVDATTRGATAGDAQVSPVCTLAEVYPAGLSIAEDGSVLVAVLSPEMSWFESFAAKPAWRSVLLRLPQGTRDALMQYSGTGMVIAFDADWNLQGGYILAGKNTLNMLTSACAVDQRVYVVQADDSETIGYFAT